MLGFGKIPLLPRLNRIVGDSYYPSWISRVKGMRGRTKGGTMEDAKPAMIDRRTFAKLLGGAGALAAGGVTIPEVTAWAEAGTPPAYPQAEKKKPREATVDPKTGELTVNEDVIVRYSGCLGCYSSCGNRVKIDRASGQVLSVGGNPYNPNCAYPYLDFDEPLSEAYLSMSHAHGKGNITRGTTCARGQGSWDAYAQPDRITVPLKRAGQRGEGKWEPISWDQLIKEVTEGGKLFADIGEDREVEGFLKLHDTETPLDPDAPELGPVSNQLVMFGGRSDGRSAIGTRFVQCFGSLNVHGHGSSCGGAMNVNVSCTSGGVHVDCENSEYVLWLGYFPGSNGKSMQGTAHRASNLLASGNAVMDVVDPVLGNGCVTPAQKNMRWIPIKTSTNAAFALGLVRWIIENETYNKEFVSYANFDAAYDAGFASFCNASHLVIVDESHPNYRKFMRAEDAGLTATKTDKKTGKPLDHYMVIDAASGQPATHFDAASGLIDYEGEVNGVKVRSAFLFLRDSAWEKSLDEWSAICEIPTHEIARIAREFTSHGTKVAVFGQGATATINGLSTGCVRHILSSLVGADQMKGGLPTRFTAGANLTDGSQYLMSTVKDKPKVASPANATYISRTGRPFETTSEYKRAVSAGEKSPSARLPWYSMQNASDNQALISLAHGYPYQAKILITWMANTIQATPGALREEIVEKLKDVDVVPLHIVCDVVMGEHAQLADYFVPDTTPYESWGIVSSQGCWAGKGSTLRWPVVESASMLLDDGRHASFEAFVADVGRACDLPGFGDEAFLTPDGTAYPFNDACDYFLKGVANLAYSDGEVVADISNEDMRMQGLDELPASWKQAVSAEEWPKVLNVLSRGGRFWPIDEAFDDAGRSTYASKTYMVYHYNEKWAANTNALTGEKSRGVMHYGPELFSDLTSMEDAYGGEYPFKSTNYKPRFRSISMLANSPIMRDLCSENYLEINIEDAADLDIVDGDEIVITNPSGDVMRGPAMVRGGIAKGTFGVAYGYGHVAYGAQDYVVDGEAHTGNPAIGAGIHLRTQLDPSVGELAFPVAEPEAGTPGRCGGFYKIEKVG